MNKVFTSVVLGAVLAGSSTAHAASELNQQLTDCKDQLAAIYGDDTRVRLRGKGVGRASILNFSVYPKGERQLRVSCTRAGDGALQMTDRNGVALVTPEQAGDTLTAL